MLPYNSRLVLRDNYGKAELDTLFRTATSFRFGSNAYSFNNKKNAAVAQLFTNWNNGSNNELFLGYTTIRDIRPPDAGYPSITVNTGITGTLIAGAEANSQGNSLDQDIFEVTDNFTIPIGAKHRVSIGTHNEFYKIDNLFARNSQGSYTFASLDSLEAGNPNSYTIGLNLGAGFHSKFNAANYSVYAEDQWTINDRFNVLYGVRLDVPTISSRPPTNPLIETLYGRDTHEMPTGNVQFSPRVGFNWDVTGKQADQVRGGVGRVPGSAGIRVAREYDRELRLRTRPAHLRRGRTRTRAGVRAGHQQPAADVPRHARKSGWRGRLQRGRPAQQGSEVSPDAARDAGIRSPVRQRLRRNAGGDLHARVEQLLLPEHQHRRPDGRRQIRPHDLRDGVRRQWNADYESRQHAVQGGRHLRRQESVEGLFVPAHGAAEEALLGRARGERRVHARALVLGAGHHQQHGGVELQVRSRALGQPARREHGHLAVRHSEQGADRRNVHGAVEDVADELFDDLRRNLRRAVRLREHGPRRRRAT